MRKLKSIDYLLLLICVVLLSILIIGLYSGAKGDSVILSSKDGLQLSLGAIGILMTVLGFYFGYKRYERDKELEIIDKLENEYNKIDKKDIKKLVNFWYKEFYFYKKNYISREWWLYVYSKIYKNLTKIAGKKFSEDFASEIVNLRNFNGKIGFEFGNFLINLLKEGIEEQKKISKKLGEDIKKIKIDLENNKKIINSLKNTHAIQKSKPKTELS